jgi:hypothetical protein
VSASFIFVTVAESLFSLTQQKNSAAKDHGNRVTSEPPMPGIMQSSRIKTGRRTVIEDRASLPLADTRRGLPFGLQHHFERFDVKRFFVDYEDGGRGNHRSGVCASGAAGKSDFHEVSGLLTAQ